MKLRPEKTANEQKSQGYEHLSLLNLAWSPADLAASGQTHTEVSLSRCRLPTRPSSGETLHNGSRGPASLSKTGARWKEESPEGWSPPRPPAPPRLEAPGCIPVTYPQPALTLGIRLWARQTLSRHQAQEKFKRPTQKHRAAMFTRKTTKLENGRPGFDSRLRYWVAPGFWSSYLRFPGFSFHVHNSETIRSFTQHTSENLHVPGVVLDAEKTMSSRTRPSSSWFLWNFSPEGKLNIK